MEVQVLQHILKKCKNVFLMVSLFMLVFSMTAKAENINNEAEKQDISEYEITLDTTDNVYTGKEIKPGVTVSKTDEAGTTSVLTENEDYSVTYSNNINAGEETASVRVEGMNGFEGSIEKSFTIKKASLNNTEITLSTKTYTYNGNAKKPTVTVKLNGTVIDSSNYSLSYSDNKQVGTAYVTVTATEGNLTGTKELSFRIIPKTPVISLTRAYNKMKISWNKVSQADGYQIYRSTSKDSGYTRIKTVTSGSTLSYTDSSVKHNVKYYYKVRAYTKVNDTKVYSAYSSVKYLTVRVAKAAIEKIIRINYHTLKITWDSVDGATGYRVYRSKTKDGEYKAVATLAGNDTVSYNDTDLKCGRRYYYKVSAYRKIDGVKYFGTYSEAKNWFTRPSKVKLTDECYYKATKTTLEWTKSKIADGYEIYRSTTKNGTYTKVKTITSADTLTWTNTGLSKTKNYYYKIRAYRKVDGRTVYSAYSDIFRKRKAGWRYSTFEGKKIKYYYNADNERVKDVSNLIGKQSSYVIKVNKQRATVTVYAKDGDNGYIIPVKAFVCSPGYSTPEGTFNTQQKLRWHELMGPCWGQWNTRISGSYLFHSVFYNSYRNSDALSVTAYNKLGTVCSHGCVRLTAGDAKWIYDNCKLGTKVIIYNSSVSGPFGKPSAVKLPYWHTWDPTDPNKFDKCDEIGCH